ncbi:ankyrin repeat domain-containing protein [bacterium]|nr:ankyrin repeat domain-containing protein [candidate division CSSED10-310 bacterium]
MIRFLCAFMTVLLIAGCSSEIPKKAEQPATVDTQPEQPMEPKRSSEPEPDTIFSAAAKGQLATIMRLLDEGTDVNLKDASGMTALSWASMRGRAGIVRYLLEHNANPNIPDDKGLYPLHKACLFGDESVIQNLLDFNADVNAAGPEGVKAIDIARRMKREKAVELLEIAMAKKK